MTKYKKLKEKVRKQKKAFRKSTAKAQELALLREGLEEELKIVQKAYKKAKKKQKQRKKKYKQLKEKLVQRQEAEKAPNEVVAIPRETATDEADDLKVIEGIGPKLEILLHRAQILTYRKLAEQEEAVLIQLLEEGGLRPGIYRVSHWIRQATIVADTNLDTLKKYQSKQKENKE